MEIFQPFFSALAQVIHKIFSRTYNAKIDIKYVGHKGPSINFIRQKRRRFEN